MRSKSEIKNKIELLKSIYFKDNTTETQQIILANRINELKWVIKDNSDDSWMFSNYKGQTNERNRKIV